MNFFSHIKKFLKVWKSDVINKTKKDFKKCSWKVSRSFYRRKNENLEYGYKRCNKLPEHKKVEYKKKVIKNEKLKELHKKRFADVC